MIENEQFPSDKPEMFSVEELSELIKDSRETLILLVASIAELGQSAEEKKLKLSHLYTAADNLGMEFPTEAELEACKQKMDKELDVKDALKRISSN